MKNIVIGKVLKPQGIRGEIKVLPITDDANRFKELRSVFIGEAEYSVNSVSIREDGVFMLVNGVYDRNGAEALRNRMLSVPRAKAVKPDEDSWFIVDLIGCKVRDDEGNSLGVLTDVLQNGCADVYCVDGGRIMFPALKKLLRSVDVEAKEIVVDRQVLLEVAVYEN